MNARWRAEGVVEDWERAEDESMREGHKETMVRLIEAAIEAAYDCGYSDAEPQE